MNKKDLKQLFWMLLIMLVIYWIVCILDCCAVAVMDHTPADANFIYKYVIWRWC